MKERTLLKQLQRKNEKALEEIMKKYGAYVTTISKEILAGKGTKEDVEEGSIRCVYFFMEYC